MKIALGILLIVVVGGVSWTISLSNAWIASLPNVTLECSSRSMAIGTVSFFIGLFSVAYGGLMLSSSLIASRNRYLELKLLWEQHRAKVAEDSKNKEEPSAANSD